MIQLWRVEKRNNNLGPLPVGFYSDAQKSLGTIPDPYEKKKFEDLFQELVYMRQHKMLMAALRQIQGEDKPAELSGTEDKAYSKVLEILRGMVRKTEREEPKVEEVEEDKSAIEEEEKDQRRLGDAEVESDTAERKEEPVADTSAGEAQAPEEDDEDGPSAGGVTSGPEEDSSPRPAEGGEEATPVEPEDAIGGAAGGEAQEEGVREEVQEPASEPALTEKVDEPAEKNTEDAPEAAGGVGGTLEAEAGKGEEKVEEPQKDVFKEESENKGDFIRVRFLKPLPAFVGHDLKTIGPFEEGEEIDVPAGVAEILIKNDAAEEI